VQRGQLLTYAALAVIWGTSFLLLVKVVAAFSWIGAVTFRSLIVAGLLWTLAKAAKRTLDFGSWRAMTIVGATTVAAQLIGLSYASPRIGTAMAAIFVGAIPLFSAVIGFLVDRERMSRIGTCGLWLGFAGIVVLVGFPETAIGTKFVLGCAAMLGSTIAAAIGSNYAQRHLNQTGSWEQTIGAFLAGGVMTFPLLVAVPVPHMPRIADVGWLIALAAVCSALAYVLYFKLVAEVGATQAISVEFLVTVIAVFLGAAVLHEKLSSMQFVGGGIILLGCAMVLGLLPQSSHSRRGEHR
jgi:drug/metabolite transporter (DMT)-like permease